MITYSTIRVHTYVYTYKCTWKKRSVQSKSSKRQTAVSGWLALISAVYAWLLCDGLDLYTYTLGRHIHVIYMYMHDRNKNI